MDFTETCFSKFKDAQISQPDNPVAGLSYLFADVMYRMMQKRIDAKEKRIFFCTVRPKEGTTFKDIQYYFNKLLQRKFMFNGFYGYECTDFDKSSFEVKGIHVHFVIPYHDMGQKRMRENIHNTFKDIASIQAIDVRVYPDSFRDDKISYIKGDKWDKGKEHSVSSTVSFRKHYNIDDINYI